VIVRVKNQWFAPHNVTRYARNRLLQQLRAQVSPIGRTSRTPRAQSGMLGVGTVFPGQ
jgi:hypothetical protein